MNLGSIQLPINSATKTFGVIGKRGGGKTYTGGVMAEEFYKVKIPFVVFDPIDTWYGLRLSVDGKGKGLPIVVFGIEHADIKLDRDMGRRIAQAIVSRNVSCIISTFGMPKKAQRWLIAEFSEELLNINNTPRHVFIEEAHEFVPQRVMGDLGRTFNAVSNLVTMGRNRGIGVTILNQRAATVNKDVLTQIDTLIAMRSVGPQDRKALREWVEHHAAEGDFENFIQSLPSLPTGKAWLWSPEFLGVFEQITIRKRETFHPDREKIGDKFEVPALASTDVENFITNFTELEAKAKKQEANAKARTKVKDDEPAAIIKPPSGQRFDWPGPDKAEIIALRNEYESKLIGKDGELQSLRAEVNRLRTALANIAKLAGGYSPANGTAAVVAVASDSVALWLGKLGSGGAGRMFKFLAENPGKQITRNQLALAAGLSASSGTFGTYLSKLRSNHLIVEQGGYYQINPEL
jgi:hypothetical protein